jgi:alkylhydroperoxidase family enzyme
MPRIQPCDPANASELQNTLLRELPGLMLFRVMAHAPEATLGFATQGRALLTQTRLDAQWRELVILTVAHRLGSDYEINEHERIAVEVGCSFAKVEALRDNAPESAADILSQQELALCRFAVQCVEQRRPAEDVFASVSAFLDDQELVELVLCIAFYQGAALFLEVFDIDPEAEGFDDNVKLGQDS